MTWGRGKNYRDQRNHRRKVAKTEAGKVEHEKREERRKGDPWRQKRRRDR